MLILNFVLASLNLDEKFSLFLLHQEIQTEDLKWNKCGSPRFAAACAQVEPLLVEVIFGALSVS